MNNKNGGKSVNPERSRRVRTRFAPSPTGYLHIGGLRTAIYAYALAKHNNGTFWLRIEDTDQKREVKGAREKIYDILNIFGLNWDGVPVIQSERVKAGIYKNPSETLLEKGFAFYCDCPPRNAKEEGFSKVLRDPCRGKSLKSGALKLKIPDNRKIEFHDFILNKDISWDSNEIADTILLKSDGYPTYHLAVVVDDNDMEISHVIRAVEWLPSTPIHLLIYEYLGLKPPFIGHPSAILDPSGGKLSKRKGNVSVEQFIEEGYLPEALLNFVILLGWAPKDNREFFTLTDFVKTFDVNGFQKSNPVFNRDKLDWFNGYYIRQKSDSELLGLLEPFISEGVEKEKLKQVIPLIKERLKKLSDFNYLAGYIFKKSVDVDPIRVTDNYDVHLSKAIEALREISGSKWNLSTISETLINVIQQNKFKTGDFYMDLRGAISGSKFTPPLNETLIPIGREDTLARLEKAIKKKK